MNSRAVRITLLMLAFLPAAIPSRGAASDGNWLPISGVPGEGLIGSVAIYDPIGQQLVQYGGYSNAMSGYKDGRAWVLPIPAPSAWNVPSQSSPRPAARYYASAIYDPVRRRLVLFGGALNSSNSNVNEVWALSLDNMTWAQLVTAGTPPAARHGHGAVYDPVRDRMIVFGGRTGGQFSETWALTLSDPPTWSQIAAANPPSAREGPVVVYDGSRDRLVVYGGSNDGYTGLTDIWSLPLGGAPAWSAVAVTGTPPAVRRNSGGVYDAAHDRLVLFGGRDATPYADVWKLDFASGAWSQVATAPGPPARDSYGVAMDETSHRMFVVFGMGGKLAGNYYGGLSDTWSLSLGDTPAWSGVHPGVPDPRIDASAIHDPPRQRMILFGGTDYYSTNNNELWQLSLASRGWQPLTASGTPPTPRNGHSAIDDPLRERMIVFGGVGTNELWSLSLSGAPQWSPLAATGPAPPARSFHTATYDPVRDRMLVFGGMGAGSVLLNDLWELSLSGPTPVWTQLSPAGTQPAPRQRHDAVYDPVRDRLLIYGGHQDGSTVWTLPLSGPLSWTPIVATGTSPQARVPDCSCMAAIYDPPRDRVVFHGGGCSQFQSSGATALSLDNPAWTDLTPGGSPTARGQHVAIYDPDHQALVVFGGRWFGRGGLNYIHGSGEELVWGNTTAVPSPRATTGLRVAAVAPDPARGSCTFTIEIPRDCFARTLDVFGVDGRRRWTRDVSSLAPGAHRVVFGGRESDGQQLEPGVYWVRLAGPGLHSSRRFVRLE